MWRGAWVVEYENCIAVKMKSQPWWPGTSSSCPMHSGLLASVTGMGLATETAARSPDASQWITFRCFTILRILPGVFGGWMLAFIICCDELIMINFIASISTSTLPVRMYQHIALTNDPLVASLAAVMILITMLLMILLDRIFGLDKLLVGK